MSACENGASVAPALVPLVSDPELGSAPWTSWDLIYKNDNGL